jgi:hypothetical protein
LHNGQTAVSPACISTLRPSRRCRSRQANGETLALQHFAPAHADSDIYVHFQNAKVISMGDTYFNGMYPYIDPGTGGKITGMIAAADKVSLPRWRLFRGTARSAAKRT